MTEQNCLLKCKKLYCNSNTCTCIGFLIFAVIKFFYWIYYLALICFVVLGYMYLIFAISFSFPGVQYTGTLSSTFYSSVVLNARKKTEKDKEDENVRGLLHTAFFPFFLMHGWSWL